MAIAKAVLVLCAAMAIAAAVPAYAACTGPQGAEGEMVYNSTYKVAQFCDGAHWISMAGGLTSFTELDPKVGSVTTGKWCHGDGSAVQCDLPPPLTSFTEVDPKVGAVTANKWCRGNGTTIQCDQSAPLVTYTETDPSSIGVGQSWGDMTASRNAATVYQNLSGRPIMVKARGVGPSFNAVMRFEVSADNSSWIAVSDDTARVLGVLGYVSSENFIVPPNHYYRLNRTSGSGGYIGAWLELR